MKQVLPSVNKREKERERDGPMSLRIDRQTQNSLCALVTRHKLSIKFKFAMPLLFVKFDVTKREEGK